MGALYKLVSVSIVSSIMPNKHTCETYVIFDDFEFHFPEQSKLSGQNEKRCRVYKIVSVRRLMNKEYCLLWFKVVIMVQWLRITCHLKGHGFHPWSGKITHAMVQLSLHAKTAEPTCRKLLWLERSPVSRNWRLSTANEDLVQPKIK